jgi:hypothetical protein
MANVPGAVIGLVGGQVAGRILGVFLSSRTGERLLERIDRRPLTPLEHRVLAGKWAGNIGKAISGAGAVLFLSRGDKPGRGGANQLRAAQHNLMGGPTMRNIDWVQVLQRVSEVMLAVGAIFKVVGEYLEDRQRTAEENERTAAKRLA